MLVPKWTVNETISSASPMFQAYISSYGILYEGAGTQDTSLTIPGNNTALNGTVVECRDIVNNESDSSTLYIQGMHPQHL